ncbi:hypothetical protein NW761_003482 [Fusarium oxysporum]|nr:hypothetical protein NW758_001339 [Fusarium oxysporum]KAJ4100497.1 hypothetical protein NW761_003482 [Fusarium oxysporum]
MPLALSLPHRCKLSKTDCKPSSTAGLHKRLIKRLSHAYQRTRDIFEVKLNSTAKETWNTASNYVGDDGEPIGHHKPYNALILLFNPGYPRAGNLFPARLRTQQNVLNAHSGHLVDLGPALRIGTFPTSDHTPQTLGIPSTGDHHRAATGESSSQKRPPGSPGTSGSTSKKQRKESRQSDDRALSDTGSDDDEDDEGDSGRDGPRFPLPEDSPHPASFACPFCKNHPDRYSECKGLQIAAISYVTQHIGRRHVLKQVTMDVQETAPSTDDITYRKKRRDPEKIVYYCERCRDEFRGPGADVRWDRHSACQKRSIAQTGVLLPVEFETLKSEVRETRGILKKWEKIWTTLFPGTSVPSPYNEAEGAVSIGDVAQPHNVFQLQPFHSPINQTHHHDPPQVFPPQMSGFVQAQDTCLGNNRVFDLLNDHPWNMANNIGNLDLATSFIPNPAPTDLQTIMPAPDFMQSLISKSTQSPTFPDNDWTQREYPSTQ